ncbi:recombinase family protein [Spirosoma migulaei]
MKKAIAYYRVSTDRQGKSGLGLEAQQEAVRLFTERQGHQVTAHFTEVESGRKNQRPQLSAALAQCRKDKATLIIAKLDRLGRNVAFISNLMESKVDFIAVDNPHASRLMFHMLAAFAEHEREQISTRTKDAIAAAKRRGVQWGRYGATVLSQESHDSAERFAEDLRPTIEDLRQSGFTTIRAIRDELNRRQVATFWNSTAWHNSTVHALLKRVDNTRNSI